MQVIQSVPCVAFPLPEINVNRSQLFSQMLYMIVITQDWPSQFTQVHAREHSYLPEDSTIADMESLYRLRWELHANDHITWWCAGGFLRPDCPFEGPRETSEDLWKFCFQRIDRWDTSEWANRIVGVLYTIVEKHTLGSSEEEDMADEIDPDPEKTDQLGQIASFDNAIKCELCDIWSNNPFAAQHAQEEQEASA